MGKIEKEGVFFECDGGVRINRNGRSVCWQAPAFPLSGGMAEPSGNPEITECPWKDGINATAEYALTGSRSRLRIEIHARALSAVVRLRYSLTAGDKFEGKDGIKPIRYGKLTANWDRLTEIQLSQFDRILHSFVPAVCVFEPVRCKDRPLIGPIVITEHTDGALLFAYEHGAEAPDHFLEFRADPKGIALLSTKGNYLGGERTEDYLSPWLQIGLSPDKASMFKSYRDFMLTDAADYGLSRTPYIFYNTWHHQEGRKYNNGQPFLKDMNEGFILNDIDIAHEMGVDVYVLDTGWFQKTGDWEVNMKRFPSGMRKVREKLDAYGMRLGLWFNPTVAAETSEMYSKYRETVLTQNGKEKFCGPIWETEESWGLCLDSEYRDMFIDRLVMLYEQLGVRYFKWDGIGQYGCDSAKHFHGNEANDPNERMNVYAYRMGLQMTYVASELCRRCPDAIVDFDVTEGRRYVGLGFLSAGKYFLMNNGPYFHNFDIPKDVKREPDTINVFFYPGAARPQICRQSAEFDFLIPSVLFMTHFLPNGSDRAQRNSMAAMALGGNGIWGYLSELSKEDIARWKSFTDLYKQVRDDITKAYPVRCGRLGGSPEIHEKINPETGRGAVVVFTHGAGCFTHVTQPLSALPSTIIGAEEWRLVDENRISVTVRIAEDDAAVVFLM